MRSKAVLRLKRAAWTGAVCLREVLWGVWILWEKEVASLSSRKIPVVFFFTKLGQVSAIISLIFLNKEAYFQNVRTAINLWPVESFRGCWSLPDEILGRRQQNRSSPYHEAWWLNHNILWATKNTFYLYLTFDRQLRAYEIWLKHEVGKMVSKSHPFFPLVCVWMTQRRAQQSQALGPSLPLYLQAVFFRRWIFLHLSLMLYE